MQSRITTLVAPLLAATALSAAQAPAARAAGRSDVAALVARMSVAEKLAMVDGVPDTTCGSLPEGCAGEGGYITGVPRLGIPPLRLGDGPAGVRATRQATAMPAPAALAATFDPGAAARYGTVLGREARAIGWDVLLAPMVNLVRVPIAGRNWETLGEDPLLAARLAAPEVGAIQRQGVIADVKHFAENGFERRRHAASVQVDARTLHETELVPFEAAVRAGVGSVMCAYNRVNDVFACSSSSLLQAILRRQWGFSGFVRSDGSATHFASDLLAGLDMEIPGGSAFPAIARNVFTGTPAVPATNDFPAVPAASARRWMSALDGAVRRILGQMDRFGMLDGSRTARPALTAVRAPDRDAAEQVALEGATLLLDRHQALPLSREDLQAPGIVAMGATADAPMIGGRGSGAVKPFPDVLSPLAALTALAPGAPVRYVPGYDLDGVVVPPTALRANGRPGLLREQLRPDVYHPQPVSGPTPDRVDQTVDYTGAATLPAGTAWRWTGALTPPRTGTYTLRLEAADQSAAALYVGGAVAARLGGFPAAGLAAMAQSERTHHPPFLQQAGLTARLRGGRAYPIDLRVRAGSSPLRVRLAWSTPDLARTRIAEAVAAARSARTAIVFAYDEDAERGDRASMQLPGYQDRLIDAVARVNPRTIVVLNTGDPVTMPWLGRVAAVLEMWYPGQAGGSATAKLLLGLADPAGKLPMTFPRDWRDQPTYSRDGSRYPGRRRAPHGYPTMRYDEGVFCGYRWYDRQHVRPLFEFGHGLSYTSFRYSGLRVRRAGGGFMVRFVVRNSGAMTGAEVAQVYLGAPRRAPVPMPPRALVGFQRVRLHAGGAATVTVAIEPRELSYWAARRHRWERASGARAVLVGSSSRDIRLTGRTPG